MKKYTAAFMAALVSLVLNWPSALQAMTVEVHGNQVFATGRVDDDLRKFEEALAKPGVDTVVFVNSPGGDLWTGLRVGRLIADKGVKTVIAGSCVSACSIMFMGGRQRQFSDAMRPNLTFIGIHGAHNKDTKSINPSVQPQIFAFYKQHIGEKFNTTVMNQALYDMDDAGSLLRVFDPVRSIKTLPYHCKSSQTPRDKCSKFEATDAVSLGIVTTPELLQVNLPANFKASNAIFGRELTVEVTDLPATLAELAEAKCPVPTCKDNVKKLLERQEHRAIALSPGGTGVGMSMNADTPTSAATRAIYNCNHSGNGPARLCEVAIVDRFSVSAHYADSDSAHATALASLKPPADKFYGNEEFGGGFTTASGLRRENLNDITPQSLEGIKTIGTQELAKKLTLPGDVTALDVVGLYQTIPGSKVLLNSGTVLEIVTADEAFEKRFAGLLSALVPDKSSAIVFFCGNRNCWLSANAAMRAKKLGFTQVLWYRGGIESWKGAGLPTAPGIVRAVVN